MEFKKVTLAKNRSNLIMRYVDSPIKGDSPNGFLWDENYNASGPVEVSIHISLFLNYVSSIEILVSG